MNAPAQIIPISPTTSSLTHHAVNISELKAQVNLIQYVMRDVMKSGEHYGTIPGCGDKAVLLKPGAEKLMLTFRLANDVEVETIDLHLGHREYRIKVTLYSPAGQRLGTGVGSCSTMESKYRFRVGPVELTNKPVPKEYWDLRKENPVKAQEIIGGRGFSAKKDDSGNWKIARQGEKVEHDNPADFYNTCLKMAKSAAWWMQYSPRPLHRTSSPRTSRKIPTCTGKPRKPENRVPALPVPHPELRRLPERTVPHHLTKPNLFRLRRSSDI